MTDRFKLPDWYEKSARQTKNKYLNDQIGQGLADYGSAAYAGRDEEERRGAAAESTIREANARADKPTITQEEIDRQFGRASDAASQGFASELEGLRDYAGASGVSGGQVNGLLVNADLKRLSQLTAKRGDLMSFKATSDAMDRQKMVDRAGTLAAYQSRPVSMLGIDFENQALQTRMAQLGLEVNRSAAKDAANAAKPGLLDYVSALAPIAGAALG